MAKIKKLLLTAKINKQGQGPLVIAVYDTSSQELIATGETIDPDFWDKENRCVRVFNDDTKDIDEILGDMEVKVTAIKRELKVGSKVEPTARQIKMEWIKRNEARKEVQEEENKKIQKSEKLITKNLDLWFSTRIYKSSLTKKGVLESVRRFKEYLLTTDARKMQDISQELVDGYSAWLFSKKNLRRSSHGFHMKRLKWFLKSTKPPNFDFRDIALTHSKKVIIALTMEELTALENVDVSKVTPSLKEWERKKGTPANAIPSEKNYQHTKDLWLLGAYTALRVSDLRRLNKNMIESFITGDKEIHIRTQKTKKDLAITILPEAWEILSRYGLRAPRVPGPAANRCIKGLCKAAGINKVITWTETKGNIEVDMESPKYELMSMHVSGKTFISLAEERWDLTISEIASIVDKHTQTISAHYKSNDNRRANEKMKGGGQRVQSKNVG